MSEAEHRFVIYGAGGHGRVVLDLLVRAGHGPRVLGLLDDGRDVGSACDGYPILGGEAWLSPERGVQIALGIGDNRQRARIAGRCEELGLSLTTAIHPQAVVSASSRIGPGSVVFAGAIINTGAEIGKGCIVNSGAVVEHDCRLGDFSHVSPNSALGGAATLGRFAHLGLGACVLPGLSVGEGSIVGAGGVVTKAIPSRSVAYGVPARVQRSQS
jgi:UDP-N-acetylbacillosamine N-acetyltransferase